MSSSPFTSPFMPIFLHLPCEMRRHALLFGLTAFILVFSTLPNVSTAIPPTWLVRTATATLENTCQCDCCYPVGVRGRTECVPPMDTSFDIPVCSRCDVDACAARFPVACAQASSIVNSDCITRKGWMLRLVPIFFIVVSASLLCYGLFFKQFDGYHDDRVQAPVLRDGLPQPYNTFSQVYNQAARSPMVGTIDKTSARSPSLLPPILETEELSGNVSPYSGVSTTMPSSVQVPQPSLGEQPNVPRGTENIPQ